MREFMIALQIQVHFRITFDYLFVRVSILHQEIWLIQNESTFLGPLQSGQENN
ncbi:hypothetical protein BDE02_06G224300 [Populus trichocarpa]|nr:hypothetical protein BDE02_06G224300 [Populus trichocarpa]